MELEFKEGERVFDIRYGWGTIKEPINECFTAVIFEIKDCKILILPVNKE